jgi:DNA polymerase-3 subunit delta
MKTLTKYKIDPNNLPKIITIFGEEEFLINQAISDIIKAFQNSKDITFGLEKYDCSDFSLEDITNFANTSSFLYEKKAIVLKNFENCLPKQTKKTPEQSMFYKYLQNPSPFTILIIQVEHNSLNGLTKSKNKGKIPYPLDILTQKYFWLEFPKIYPSDFAKFVKEKASQMKLSISVEAIELLVARSGDSLRSLWNELEKLSIYASGVEKIEITDVLEVSGNSKEFSVFDLQNQVGRKDLKSSIITLNNLLENDRQEMLIISILQKFFLQLFKLTEMDVNENKFVLAGKLGVNAYFLDDYKAYIRLYKSQSICNALNELMIADEQIKSSNADNLSIMVKLITKIITN